MEISFISSLREDDKWAAIERLPTFSSARRGLLVEAREIGVENLGLVERKTALERLVKSAEKDNENVDFVLFLTNAIHKRAGLGIPKIELRFEHLNVEAEVYVRSRALRTILNFFVNIFEIYSCCKSLSFTGGSQIIFTFFQQERSNFKSFKMLVVSLDLKGPPSSGKTTLLKALAGRLDRDLKVSD
ncbi:hypothetical protein TIFTF001_014387 [Ficus carica]|uniref:Uncharacterized protein n=1 Tax=Ficus carica TaxID=3494 RepID=A0AA88D6Y1_FICCA|nr:hypothetical protein TIFTF001_014387 [Ficus carica]